MNRRCLRIRRSFVNGDVDAQVTTALRALLCSGVVERTHYGYRLAGRPVGSATVAVPLGPRSTNTPIVFQYADNGGDAEDDQSSDT